MFRSGRDANIKIFFCGTGGTGMQIKKDEHVPFLLHPWSYESFTFGLKSPRDLTYITRIPSVILLGKSAKINILILMFKQLN